MYSPNAGATRGEMSEPLAKLAWEKKWGGSTTRGAPGAAPTTRRNCTALAAWASAPRCSMPQDQGLECVEAQPKVVLVAAHGGGEGVRYPVWARDCRWRREVDHDRHLRAESRAAGPLSRRSSQSQDLLSTR